MNHVRIMTGVGAALMAWQTLATPVAAEPISFREYQSAKDVSMYELKDDVPFSPLWHAAGTPVLDLDSSKPSHKYLGLGVSFAEASCKILMELSSAEREKVMRMLWTKEGGEPDGWSHPRRLQRLFGAPVHV